jgi:hypothetical protein
MRGRAVATERELRMLWSLKRKAGSRAELLRWIDSYPEPKRGKRGPRRKDFFKDFSVVAGPVKGVYLVRFRVGSAAPLVCAFVKERGARLPKGMVEVMTRHQIFRKIAETLDKDQPGRAGAGIDAITHWLDEEFRKAKRGT